jgi:hypothetical protein
MKQIRTRLAALVTIAFLSGPSSALSQTKAEPYRPLTIQEMAEQGLREQWAKTFSEMTGKQKAEVMRRHVKMCLDSFKMTDEQRAFVKDASGKVFTEEIYSTTDPEKRLALQQRLQPIRQKAMSLLGPDLAQTILDAKPPISVLEAVKSDPAFK